MKKLNVRLICDSKTLKDDYGWEIPASKAMEAFNRMREELGDANLLDQLADALSYQELADNLAYICRMNDLHIPQLVDEDDVEEFEEDIDVDDALRRQPSEEKLDDPVPGEGRIKRKVGKYRGYTIVETEDGKFDVYDNMFATRGVKYDTIEAAKKDIDLAEDEQVFEEESIEQTIPANTKKIAALGYLFIPQGNKWLVKAGGLANKEGSTGIDYFDTLGEAIDELINAGYLTEKDVLKHPVLSKEYKEYLDI